MEQSDRVRSSDKKCVSSDKKLKFFEKKRLIGRSLSSLRVLDFAWGSLLIVNFLVVWSIPITIQGLIWKHTPVSKIAKYVHDSLGASTRKWAATFLYSRTRYSDYCATSLLICVSSIISIGAMLYFQLSNPGHLPPLAVVLYAFIWVGPGGRTMGGVYALAHREGHIPSLYRKEVRFNYFENAIGCFYGIVPASFTTSHVSIHHALGAGAGDTFYLWDLDRSSLQDFPIYVARVFRHMICWSSLRYYSVNGQKKQHARLSRGVIAYACVIAALWRLTKSPMFVFYLIIQPLFCMTVFLAVINYAFHGFFAAQPNGKVIPSVISSTIIEGDDDYWGEDDHMTHHKYPVAHHDDIPRLHAARVDEFRKTKASVFRGLSSFELGVFMLLGLWDRIASHFVDYSRELADKKDIVRLLRARAQKEGGKP